MLPTLTATMAGGARGLWGRSALGGGFGERMNGGIDTMDTKGLNKRGASDDNDDGSKRDKREVLLHADDAADNDDAQMNPNDDTRASDVTNRIKNRGHEAVLAEGGFKSNIKME